MNNTSGQPENQGPGDPTHFPADPLVEEAVIGSILLEPLAIEQLPFLQPSHFYFSRYGEIFQIMRKLHESGSPIDPVLIADRDPELISICTQAYHNTPTAMHVVHYAMQVRNLAQKRGMIPMLTKAAEMAFNGVPSSAVVQYLETALDSDELRDGRDTWQVHRASGLAEPPRPREWLLEGLIFRGQISMWYGPPGIRKSLLLADACAAMATGQNWLVRRSFQQDHASLMTFHATRKARILWLDYDNGEFETEIRIRAALAARDGLQGAEFCYMSETTPWLALDNASHVRRIIRMALDVGADVIVIDALGMVLGQVDENSPDVAKVIANLKEIRSETGAAIVCIHHPSKMGANNDKSTTYNAAGSAKFSNFFEWSIELRAGEEAGTIVGTVVKHRGWAKATKFAAELDYKHFDKERPELAHELSSFKFYPAAIESAGEKRTTLIRETACTLLAQSPLNQSALIEAIKAELDSALGKPVGVNAIREVIKAMVAAKELCTQKGADNATLYALP